MLPTEMSSQSRGAQTRLLNDRQKAKASQTASSVLQNVFSKPAAPQARVNPSNVGNPVQQQQAPIPQKKAPAHMQQSMGPQPVGELGAFLKAISAQESGGDYGAVGVPTKYGTALGKYQVLDANIQRPEGWDQEALGREIDTEAFLASPALQEAIARTKLTQYFKNYGPEGAAKAWYAGPGNANSSSDAPQYGGPSINDYASSVLANMARYR